jgi:hypothetical protein
MAEKTALIPRKKPVMYMGCPVWWHHHGCKIKIKSLNLISKELLLFSSTVFIRICLEQSVRKEAWGVAWHITHFYPTAEIASGKVLFSKNELKAAFCLGDDLGQESRDGGMWLIDAYGGDIAAQGKFILYTHNFSNFLNIPCPGTGHDGDPNVSILVSDEIREAISKLVGL